MRSRNPFTTVTTAGLLLPVDLLSRVVEGDADLPGLSPKDYHLRGGDRLNEAAARAWNECLAAWTAFRKRFQALPASDTGTSLTRDEWLLPLFQELGYGRLQTKKAIEIDGREYPVSHGWEGHVPVHLLSARYPLDRRTPGVSGAATRSPYSLVQELLNRSAQMRWGFVSNGLKLDLLRDNAALARAANVEFDLEAMLDGEHYADFRLLFLLCHQSRVELRGVGGRGSGVGEDDAGGSKPEDCWLERWANLADTQGTRAREKLRDGVEAAIKALGAGFLRPNLKPIRPASSLPDPRNPKPDTLRNRLRSGELPAQDYYRQLLRLVYRLLMLLVAEEKKIDTGGAATTTENLLHPPGTPPEVRERYARFYSVGRVRTLAMERRGTAHGDLYESLKVLFLKLRTGYEPLGIPGMGSFLFSEEATPDLDAAALSNQDLLDAFRHLCYTEDTSGRGGGVRRPVDFGNLGSEELGSVYESLLELHPLIDTPAGPFTLGTAAGHERKTTGSYYTPASLINCLLDSALDPVVAEAIDVPDAAEAERRLLALRVCDPACGSGHFLIAAAERMATHLARLRTGDDQPSALEVQHAKRDVIGRCIYGVDLNPMAVELCKVSLWMEALEPGKPLSFLDHHIQHGNSLLGATPRLLVEGIPDDAFKPIEGDDKKFCAELKKQNKKERKDRERGQSRFRFEPLIPMSELPQRLAAANALPDGTLAELDQKKQATQRVYDSPEMAHARFLADAWCAAFVWRKTKNPLGKQCPTDEFLFTVARDRHHALPHVAAEIERLREQYRFFHWHLAYPDVFLGSREVGSREVGSREVGSREIASRGEVPDDSSSPLLPTRYSLLAGFDVVLGNPPWERVKLQEKEWFAERSPEIAAAPNAAARARKIKALIESEPALHAAFLEDRRQAEGVSHFVRDAGLYPLCGRGDVNTYQLFAELNRALMAAAGRVGCIVPSGIATDATTQYFFQDLMDRRSLASLFDFENRKGIFPAVDSRMKFCLLTLTGPERPAEAAEFAFFAHGVEDLADPQRRFALTPEDIALLNPNTRTCPIFRTRADAEITRHIYRRVPVLIRESLAGMPEQNPWGVVFKTMFHMSNDSHLFRTREQLESEAWHLTGNTFEKDGERYLPLYEAKMVTFFDHRAADVVLSDTATIRQGQPESISTDEHQDPARFVMPRAWVDQAAVDDAMNGRNEQWMIGLRDVTSATNERTVIASIIPRAAVGNNLPVVLSKSPDANLSLLNACLSSFALDFAARFKVAALHLNFFIVQQFPVLPPEAHYGLIWEGEAPAEPLQSMIDGASARQEPRPPTPSSVNPDSKPNADFFISRVLELTYTAWDLQAFARDCDYAGPPFRWDEERRFLLRCELDAAYFHLYLGGDSEWGVGSREDDDPTSLTGYSLLPFKTPRDAAAYILDTFPIVRRKDEQAHGEYRTKNRILAIYDAMAEAIRTGQPYQTELNPPPGPPAEWYDPAQDKHLAPSWGESAWPKHIHRPRGDRQRVARGRAILDVLLLLEGWGKPVSVSALEPAFVLMCNEPARKVLLEQTITPSERQRLTGPPQFVAGFDAMCQGMHVNGVIRLVGERAYELAQPERLAQVSDEDRQRAAETIQAIERLGEREQIADVVAEVTDERYEVALQ